ncbi:MULTISPECIES: glutaredoxin family protein [Vibrio]|nr:MULTISPECIES: glutaredoxin family protein [Vibrio]MDN3697755.1 glutaredoxin family protein [Vibrio cortegadensis]NOH85675.1 glutaredoxin family protein [Vibrio sp. 03-59-1]TKF20750.1 glutaredoxin family protein [Vibrio genomosp. F6]
MLTLYSTEGCHLCEMAFELLQSLNLTDQVEVVDIAFDDELFSRYGVTIPVLKYQNSEINWPFGLQELQDWLNNNGITYHT